MKVLFSILLTLFLPLSSFAFESRQLGDIEMRMRSRSFSDINEVLLEILTVAVTILDNRFEEHYATTESIDFDKVSLSALSYDLDEVDGGYLAILNFKGRAFFADGTSPSQDDVFAFTSETFQQENQAFLQALMKSDDPFLTDISYAIVKVNGDVVVEDNNARSSVRGASGTAPSVLSIVAASEV
jgi:hypothetical protein